MRPEEPTIFMYWYLLLLAQLRIALHHAGSIHMIHPAWVTILYAWSLCLLLMSILVGMIMRTVQSVTISVSARICELMLNVCSSGTQLIKDHSCGQKKKYYPLVLLCITTFPAVWHTTLVYIIHVYIIQFIILRYYLWLCIVLMWTCLYWQD